MKRSLFFALMILGHPISSFAGKRHKHHDHQFCVAHRGYSSKALENSQQAFVAAFHAGAKVIEFDVHHTADGIGMVHHDATPDRTAVSKENGDCKLTTRFDQQNFLDIRANCQLVNDEEIPTLAETLRFFSHEKVKFFVELKDSPSRLTLELLKEYAAKVTVISFEQEYLNMVAEHTTPGKHIPLILLADDFIPLPDKFDGLGTQDFNYAQRVDLRSRGKITSVWTVDDFKTIKNHFLEGTDYVTTNEVETCLRALEQAKKEQAKKKRCQR